MKSVAGTIMLAVALAGCSVHTTDRDTSAQAFARDTRAADCDRHARTMTSSDETAASPALSGSPWTETNEWATATAGSKAQIERDIRWRQYQDCLGR